MAEAIFRDFLKKNHLENKVRCDSAGTANYHVGQNPDPRTVSTLQINGISIDHKGQQFITKDFDEYDYIIAMDHSNLRDVLHLGGAKNENVFLMRHFDSLSIDADVPDPYYGGQSGFTDVYDVLERSCSSLIDFIRKEHQLDG